MTDYSELVKFLRGLSPWAFPDASNKRMRDAADAIEALQDTVQAQDKALKECARQLAKMGPKRGEWVRVEDEESYHYECSECGERPLYSRYGDVVLSGVCPMCGAKQEVHE